MKRILTKGLAVIAVAFAVNTTAQDYILHPGYIEGTVSIPDGEGGEYAIHTLVVSAQGKDPVTGNNYSASAYLYNTNAFTLVVEGGDWPYTLAVRAYYGDNYDRNRSVRWSVQKIVGVGEHAPLFMQTDAVIKGTASVVGEVIEKMHMSVTPLGANMDSPHFRFESSAYFEEGEYWLPVVGGSGSDVNYRVNSGNVLLEAPTRTLISLGYRSVMIASGEEVVADFDMTPGYVEGTVAVIGANLKSSNSGYVGVKTYDPVTRTTFYGNAGIKNDSTYRLPVAPGGQVEAYGNVITDQGQVGLERKNLADVEVGQTVTCDWEVSFNGVLEGLVNIEGVDVDKVLLYGYGPNNAYRSKTINGETNYYWNVPPGSWDIQTYVQDIETDDILGVGDTDTYRFPKKTAYVEPDGHTVLDFNLEPGFIEGTLLAEDCPNIPDLSEVNVQAEPPVHYTNNEGASSLTRDRNPNDENFINSYDLFITPGETYVHSVDLRFEHWYTEGSYFGKYYLKIYEYMFDSYGDGTYDYNVPMVMVETGQVTQVDLGYQTAQITARLRVATGEPLSNPVAYGTYLHGLDGIQKRRASIRGESLVNDVQEGLVHMCAIPGTYRLSALAYVQGGRTTFGQPFEISVGAGDVVIIDPDAPIITIITPEGSQELTESWVLVAGTVVDDSAITNFTVNGQPVDIAADDSFETVVYGLVPGENVITLTACDEHGNCSTVERKVYLINSPPVASAGDNVQIGSISQFTTLIQGSATDPDGDPLLFRWLEGATVLSDWALCGPAGEAALGLSTLPYLSMGNYTLTLEVSDGSLSTTDEMILTIANSPPVVQPAPLSQTVEIGVDPVVCVADVADFDGNLLNYSWLKGSDALASGAVNSIQGGEAVMLPDLIVPAGDPRFQLGSHVLELRVDDGVNSPVSRYVVVEVVDTEVPSLRPVPSTSILWPPDHKMHTVLIQANAFDNGGGAITLYVDVMSSEPVDDIGDGTTEPDWIVVGIDQQTGFIELQLRAERAGMGVGRIYIVTVTATDTSGNESMSILEIRAPHDRRTK